MAPAFPVVRATKADHADSAAVRLKDQHMEPIRYRPNGNEALFAIRPPIVDGCRRIVPVEVTDILEWSSVLLEVRLRLPGIPFVIHDFLSLRSASGARAGT